MFAGGAAAVEKGNHRHFMQKEIYEQPETTGRTIARYVNAFEERVEMPDLDGVDLAADSAIVIGCGTAHYAGRVAEYWLEQIRRHRGGDRHRLRVPLPQAGVRQEELRGVRLAIGRNRRHAGGAALLQRTRAEDAGRRQRAGIARSGAKPMRGCRRWLGRKSAWRRPRRSRRSFPRWPRSPSPSAARAGALSSQEEAPPRRMR